MKKVIISLGASILLTTMSTEMAPTIVQADSGTDVSSTTEDTPEKKIIDHGNYGVDWNLTADGILHIYSGKISGPNFSNVVNDKSKVKKVVFEGKPLDDDGTHHDEKTNASEDASNFFSGFTNLEEIDNLNNFDTSKTTNMSGMFRNISNLKTVDLSQLNISSATNFSLMFSNTGMSLLNLSGWNVNKVTNFDSMFAGANIENLIISGWNFKDGKDAATMFLNSNIVNLDASKLDLSNTPDPSKATVLDRMFFSMPKLESIDVSNWKFPDEGASMKLMFVGDTALKKLDLSTWDNMGSDFTYGLAQSGITQLKVSSKTALNDSYLGMAEGYLFKSGGPAAQLTPVSELKTGYSGTYNYVSPTEIPDHATVTVESNRGQQSAYEPITVQENDPSAEIEVPVPSIKGATSDKETVKGILVATVDASGKPVYSIQVTDPKKAGYVTYTGGETNTGGSSKPSKPSEPEKPAESEKPAVTQAKKLISIQLKNGTAKLYHDDATLITDRVLSNDTDWYSDQKMVVNGDTYYRVANDEWVKANDSYIYENKTGVVVTQNKGYQQLTNAQGKLVTDRALGADTSWKTDRIAYINGEKYYRVATNEFVPVDSVEIN